MVQVIIWVILYTLVFKPFYSEISVIPTTKFWLYNLTFNISHVCKYKKLNQLNGDNIYLFLQVVVAVNVVNTFHLKQESSWTCEI